MSFTPLLKHSNGFWSPSELMTKKDKAISPLQGLHDLVPCSSLCSLLSSNTGHIAVPQTPKALPQGLCTYCSFCLKCSSPEIRHVWVLLHLQGSAQRLPPPRSPPWPSPKVPDSLSPDFISFQSLLFLNSLFCEWMCASSHKPGNCERREVVGLALCCLLCPRHSGCSVNLCGLTVWPQASHLPFQRPPSFSHL